MNEYRSHVSRMTFADAFPRMGRDPRYATVRELDAERVRIAKLYETNDGALLVALRNILKREQGGVWTAYSTGRILPGSTVGERIALAEDRPVAICRFSGGAAYATAHCEHCHEYRWECRCPDPDRLPF